MIGAASHRLLNNVNWSTVTGAVNAVAWNQGAGSSNVSTLCYTNDGIVWGRKPLVTIPSSYATVTYGGGKWVALYDNDAGYNSTDGLTWSSFSTPTVSNSFQEVAYGGTYYVGISISSPDLIYSTDATSWTKQTYTGFQCERIQYGNSTFVIVGDTGNNVLYGSNPASLSTASTGHTNGRTSRLKFANGRFIFFGVAATSPPPVPSTVVEVVESTDGISWTTTTTDLPSRVSVDQIEYFSGKYYVRVDSISPSTGNTGKIYTSSNLVNWTEVTLPYVFSSVGPISGLMNIDSKLIYYWPGSTTAYYTTDGTTWNPFYFKGYPYWFYPEYTTN